MKTSACVVLYHPDEKHVANVQRMAAQVDLLLVFENDASGTFTLPDMGDHVRHLPCRENIGLSAAYQFCLELANEAQAEFFLTFDQDTEIGENFVSRLIQTFEELEAKGEKPGTVGGDYFLEDREPLTQESKRISSGSCHRVAHLIEANGFPNFFIDSVDYELSLNLRKRGFTLWNDRRAHMVHHVGYATKTVKFLGKSGQPSNYPPMRYYYLIRNAGILAKEYGAFDPVETRKIRNYGYFQCLLALRFESQKLAKLAAILAGRRDANGSTLQSIRDSRNPVSMSLFPNVRQKVADLLR